MSQGRQSLIPKTAYILDTQKYNELYGTQKEDTGNRREAYAAHNAALPDTSETVPSTVSSNDIVSQDEGNVKGLEEISVGKPEKSEKNDG